MYPVTIQYTVPKNVSPATAQLKYWAKKTLESQVDVAELNIRIVDVTEMTDLNVRYRHKKGATNVLSFPFDMPVCVTDETPFLGDIIICAEVVNEEANQQGKTREAHWAHMVVHGTLHLLGYDHETDADAVIMEQKEMTLLHHLGFPNPYRLEKKGNE